MANSATFQDDELIVSIIGSDRVRAAQTPNIYLDVSAQSLVSLLSSIGEDQMDIVSSFAALPAAASNYRRTFYTVDAGAAYISDGANWLPLNDRLLFDLGATTPPTSTTGTTDTRILPLQFAIPAGMWRNNQILTLKFMGQKSGTAENCTIRFRCGTAGDVADAAISGSAGSNLSVGTADGFGYEVAFKRITATAVRKIGPGPTALNSYLGSATSDVISDVTVPNLDSNAVFITPTTQMSSTVESVTIQTYQAFLSK